MAAYFISRNSSFFILILLLKSGSMCDKLFSIRKWQSVVALILTDVMMPFSILVLINKSPKALKFSNSMFFQSPGIAGNKRILFHSLIPCFSRSFMVASIIFCFLLLYSQAFSADRWTYNVNDVGARCLDFHQAKSLKYGFHYTTIIMFRL